MDILNQVQMYICWRIWRKLWGNKV